MTNNSTIIRGTRPRSFIILVEKLFYIEGYGREKKYVCKLCQKKFKGDNRRNIEGHMLKKHAQGYE